MFKYVQRCALALLFAFACASPAFATDRVQFWFGMNPQTSWWNQDNRNIRIGDGVFRYNALVGAGVYANLCITPGSGLNVSVAPCNSTPASLYQVLPDDANSYGGPGATALPADSTPIELQGLLSTAQAFTIGPLNPPSTSGQSIIYAIECTVQTSDTNLQNVNFVNSYNQVTPGTANRDRVDRIFCQSKAGTAATSPTPPTIDTGYIGAATTTVAYGATSIGTVTMTTANGFSGFARLNSSGFISVSALPHGDYVDLANAQTIAGVKTFSSPPVMSGASISSGTIPGAAISGGIGQSLITNGYVDLSSAQTIGGAKTFSTGIGIVPDGSGNLVSASGSGANGYLRLVTNAGSNSVEGISCSLFAIYNLSNSTYAACMNTSNQFGIGGNTAVAGTFIASGAVSSTGGAVSGLHNACSSTSGLPCSVSGSCTGTSSCTVTATVPSSAICSVSWDGASGVGIANRLNISGEVSSNTLTVGFNWSATSSTNANYDAVCV